MIVVLGKCSVELMQGDITDLAVDAIVNAANAQLLLGAGVAGAIKRRGGPTIQEECNTIGGTPVGTAVLTTGGDLPAKHVIHAVGPTGDNPDRKKLLTGAVQTSIDVSEEYKLQSIAFPAISTGIFGYPLGEAAEVILETCLRGAKEAVNLQRIIICLFDQKTYQTFKDTLERMEQ